VLYFDNLSPDTVDAYLADGLTESLTERLGKIERLAIKSRTAVHRFRGRRLDDPTMLARMLGVTYLVSGSVRRVGNRLRVTAELNRPATGVRVWGEVYDRTADDLMTVETEVAERIALAVSGRLAPAERRSLAALATISRQGYDHYLRGLAHLSRRLENQRSALYALQEFETAVRFDPTFARANARIGFVYGLLLEPLYAGVLPMPRDSILARGLASTDRALLLDSTISDAWLARGLMLQQRDSTYSSKEYERAIALDPQNADALNAYGVVLLWHRGELERSRAAFERAVALDPYQPVYLGHLGETHFAVGQYARRGTECPSPHV
jgi:TolB-like protein